MKRYICTDSGSTYESYGEPEMKEYADGEYVKYSDYENLKAQLDKAEAALLLISAPHCDYRTFESETLERLIECITADIYCAREYFKEKEQV